MKTTKSLLVTIFTIVLTVQCFTQVTESIKKDSENYLPEMIQYSPGQPLSEGIYTVGNSGDFPQLFAAFNKLSMDGVSGPVTLELIDDVYIAPTDTFGFRLTGPIPGTGPDSRVTIRPAANKNVTIQGNGYRVMSFVNTSYLTLDGISLNGTTTLTIYAIYNGQFYWNGCLDFINNSDHNIVQNINFISDDYLRLSTGIAFWRMSGITDTPDSNIIQNNFIKKAGIGIYVSAFNSTNKASGNIIRYNKIGSESDSLITWGIKLEMNQNSIIENNIVRNIRQNVSCFITFGINSCVGTGNIIRNNVVYNLNSSNFYGSAGILLSGDGNSGGSDELVYNNMIYDINSTSAYCDSRVSGIQLWHQNNPGIYYNSIYLYGEGTNNLGSAALYIYSLCTNVKARNNIFVNNRDESPSFASAIYDYSLSNLESDHNDLYSTQNGNNCLVKSGNSEYFTLNEWQSEGNHPGSITEMPDFTGPYLHIKNTSGTQIISHAIPLSNVQDDYDGDLRHFMNPDIGADEFTSSTEIMDKKIQTNGFSLSQNYPNPFNPTTSIRYAVGRRQFVTLKVYDVLGNEIKTLVCEEKPAGTYVLNWNAENLPSGLYFYQLKAGSYSAVKKMILLK